MKLGVPLIEAAVLLLGAWRVHAQGTFVYDQQSATGYVPPSLTYQVQGNEPVGQSFVPSLSSVGFIQLEPGDAVLLNGLGAIVYVNLLSDSITGPVLASTESVFMPGDFFGITNFFFSTPPAVTPGTTYY